MSVEEVEELVDLILFGDIHETPLYAVIDKIDINTREMDEEAETRAAIAATIRRKYGG